MEKINKSNSNNFGNKKKDPKITAITFFIFLLVAVFVVAKCGCSSDKEGRVYNEIDAITQAHISIKNNLKSPASAEFEGGKEVVTKINDSTFVVVGAVDSQNSFGAMLRSNYSCKVIFYPKTETCIVEDVVIE